MDSNRKHTKGYKTLMLATKILTEKEAAKFLKVSEVVLMRIRKCTPTLPFMRIGQSVRYNAQDLLDWARTQRKKKKS